LDASNDRRQHFDVGRLHVADVKPQVLLAGRHVGKGRSDNRFGLNLGTDESTSLSRQNRFKRQLQHFGLRVVPIGVVQRAQRHHTVAAGLIQRDPRWVGKSWREW